MGFRVEFRTFTLKSHKPLARKGLGSSEPYSGGGGGGAGLGFRVRGSGFRVQALGFRGQGLGFRVQIKIMGAFEVSVRQYPDSLLSHP